MNEGSTPSPKNRQRVLPLVLFGAVLLPILLGVGWFINYRRSIASDVRRLETKARNKGEPITLAELAVIYPSLPDDQNGAVILMQAWEKDDPPFWKAFREGWEKLPEQKLSKVDSNLPYLSWESADVTRTNDIPPAGIKAAENYLREQKEHFYAVRDALSYSKFRFSIDITEDDPLLPHLSRLKKEALNFSIEALADCEHEDLDSAIIAIENGTKTGDTLLMEPNTISQSVRIACNSIALIDMERLLSRRSLTDAQLQRLNLIVDRMETSHGLRLAFLYERALRLSWLDKGYSGFYPFIGTKGFNQRLILQTFGEALSVGKAESPEDLRRYNTICKNIEATAGDLPPERLSPDFFNCIVQIPLKFADFEAQRRTALAALAVERYRVGHWGRVPDKLSDVDPQFISERLDPFDGKPLRFKRLEKGFLVYSVGGNRIDDGGAETNHLDITFTIER